MDSWLINILNDFGYLGIAFLIAIENIFPPIPSEIILTFSGFMTLKTTMTPFIVIIFATMGSLIGALILYYFGSIFSEEKINMLLDSKIGKLSGFKKESVHKTIIWFQNKGKYSTMFGRCIPVIRSLISIPAGMAKMPIGQFIIYTFIGSSLWNSVLVMLGNLMGENWKQVINIFNAYTNVMIMIIIVSILIFIYIKYKHKK